LARNGNCQGVTEKGEGKGTKKKNETCPTKKRVPKKKTQVGEAGKEKKQRRPT